MPIEEAVIPEQLKIVVLLAIGSILATLIGYCTHRLKLSPILGYLVAGYLIGPFSPGFVADVAIAEQLAEIGVILMMFGVGLHLRWRELLHVKAIAISGSVAQTLFATLLSTLLIRLLGWEIEAAIVVGLCLSVASTVVLARVLLENNLHNSETGHISLSWLICEDFISVIALLLLPSLASIKSGESSTLSNAVVSFVFIIVTFAIWSALLFTVGRKLAGYLLDKILSSKSHELFTLAIIAITFAIVMGSVALTKTSAALGAFMAGMMIGQTNVGRQVSSQLKSLGDLFVAMFFLSIGMLFNPIAIANNLSLFAITLFVVLVGKPLAAFAITRFLKYPREVALTVALALAQIGEFSFILAEEATKLKILGADGFDIIVGCAFLSLSLNPFLFTLLRRAHVRKVK